MYFIRIRKKWLAEWTVVVTELFRILSFYSTKVLMMMLNELTCMPVLQQSASGCMCPLQAGSGNTWCLWAGWWWIPEGDVGYQSSLETLDLSPAENRTLVSLRNEKLSVFSLVFSKGRECKISILCLYFCLVCSIPTAPGHPVWTWGSSVCASVTLCLSLHNNAGWHNTD